jgi:hypothetical protein
MNPLTRRTPIREVVPEVLPREGVVDEYTAPAAREESSDHDGVAAEPIPPNPGEEASEHDGVAAEPIPPTAGREPAEALAAEIERLEQVRRDADAEAAEARARADAVLADLSREEARLESLREEAERLEEVVRALAREHAALQKAGGDTRRDNSASPVVSSIGTAASPEPEIDDGAIGTCVIDFWRGYRKAVFYARTVDAGEELAVAESPKFRPRGNGTPDRTDEAAAAHAALVARLEAEGWRRARGGSAWYDVTFARKS